MTQAKFRKGAMVPGVEDYAAYTIDAAVDPKVSSSGWWTSKIHVFGDEELRDRILTLLNSPLRDWQARVHASLESNETVLTLISPEGHTAILRCQTFNGHGVRLFSSQAAIDFARDFGVFANPVKADADEGTTIDLRPGSANYTALEDKIGKLERERDAWKRVCGGCEAERAVVRKQRDDLHDSAAVAERRAQKAEDSLVTVSQDRDTWKRACRENYDAFCAMRNDINEMIGNMASAESTLRDGPEMQYECEAVATAVRDYVDRAKLLADEYNELRREYAAYRDTAEQRAKQAASTVTQDAHDLATELLKCQDALKASENENNKLSAELYKTKQMLGDSSLGQGSMTRLWAARETALEARIAELEKANEILRNRNISAAVPQEGLTGRTRFRTGWFGGQILQVEERHVLKRNADGVAIVDMTWRDANRYDTMTSRPSNGEW